MIERFIAEFGPPDRRWETETGDARDATWFIHPSVMLTVSDAWGIAKVVITLTDDDTDQTDVTIDGIRIQDVMRG